MGWGLPDAPASAIALGHCGHPSVPLMLLLPVLVQFSLTPF